MRAGALRLLSIALFGLLLVGCASKPVPFDRGTAASIKTIGIVTPSFPSSANVVLATSPGQSFGLIGALIDAGLQANRESRFREIVTAQQLSVPDNFKEVLHATLSTAGYTVVAVEIVDRSGTSFLAKYPDQSEPKVDAYLDVVTVGYGYVAAGIGAGAPYRPYYSIKAQLVSAKDGALLMQDSIIFNAVGPTGMTGIEAVTISPNAQPLYTTFDALVADPKGAAEGLRIATRQTAEAVGRLLR